MYSFHHIGISNLHYGLYHILLYLSRVFLIFYGRGLISMGRNKRQQNKKPLQACLSFLSLEERCRSQQSFLVARTLICFQQASSLFLELSNNAQQTITSDGGRQTRTVSSLFFKQISYAIIASIPHMGGLGFTANHTSYLFGLSFDTETGIHLLSDPGGARCQNRTALLVPKTSVLPLHFILHITRPKSESNQQPQIKCPPCTKRRSIVTMVLYH